jgi:hypothetical protein
MSKRLDWQKANQRARMWGAQSIAAGIRVLEQLADAYLQVVQIRCRGCGREREIARPAAGAMLRCSRCGATQVYGTRRPAI